MFISPDIETKSITKYMKKHSYKTFTSNSWDAFDPTIKQIYNENEINA